MTRLVYSIAIIVGVGTLIQIASAPKPLLVWNASASAPLGLYYRTLGKPQTSDWVLVRPPESAAKLAAERGYLPQNIALVKMLAAQSGDRVCRSGREIHINDLGKALALERDAGGRKLPIWSGCVTLGTDDIFVLSPAPSSFDGRYFGPIPRANIVERIAPLWTF